MADPSTLTTVYADDESIAIRAFGDYAALCPSSAMLAEGTDGVFTSGDRWTLDSVSVPFTSNGVAVGNVLRLIKPESIYAGGGVLMGVSSVAAGALTLRRLGKATGIGQPPGPTGGLSSVSFEIKTFAALIEQVSYDLNQQYGIDPTSDFTGPTALYDLRQLRQCCVLTVLVESYIQANRAATGDFAMKIDLYKAELERILGWMKVRWTRTDGEFQSITRFNTRIVR